MATTVVVTWCNELAGNLEDLCRIGVLTTEHAASSHGLPVVVADGEALGTSEVGPLEAAGAVTVDDPTGQVFWAPLDAAQLALVEAARLAGYAITVRSQEG